MSDHFFKTEHGRGVITLANIFQYKNFTFEWHYYLGPTKLNKNLKFSKRQGRKFYKVIDSWVELSKNKQEKYRIYG